MLNNLLPKISLSSHATYQQTAATGTHSHLGIEYSLVKHLIKFILFFCTRSAKPEPNDRGVPNLSLSQQTHSSSSIPGVQIL